MNNKKSPFVMFLSVLAITGNILFILWITYNGMKEHFNGNINEKISYVGLILLLILNTFFVIRWRENSTKH